MKPIRLLQSFESKESSIALARAGRVEIIDEYFRLVFLTLTAPTQHKFVTYIYYVPLPGLFLLPSFFMKTQITEYCLQADLFRHLSNFITLLISQVQVCTAGIGPLCGTFLIFCSQSTFWEAD